MVMKRLALAVAVGLASSIAMAGTAVASTSPNLCISVMGSNDWCGDGLAATHAKLAVPRGLAPLAGGGFLVADSVNHVIRRVDSRGTITTIAGTGAGGFPRFGKPAADNVLGTPMGVAALPGAGYLIADSTLKQVLRVTADGRLVVAAGRGRVRLYDLKTMQRLPRLPPTFNDSSRATIDAPNRRTVQLMFISDLSNEGRRPEFLRVELVDSDTGRMLAVADSPALVQGRVSTR
jgi:hypothetical protein